ncbi:MAG TPA: hypothetical protein VMO00_02520 [Methylomirabilota bacterium]|nr:hypothetical protein [Methylomirabilota bacterium]
MRHIVPILLSSLRVISGVFLATVFPLVVPVAWATIFNVNCSVQTLQAAVDSAQPGDTINVTSVCNENVLVRNEKQRILLDGGNVATINGLDFSSPTFNVRGVTINSAGSITGGSVIDAFGTSVTVTGGSVTITNGSNGAQVSGSISFSGGVTATFTGTVDPSNNFAFLTGTNNQNLIFIGVIMRGVNS